MLGGDNVQIVTLNQAIQAYIDDLDAIMNNLEQSRDAALSQGKSIDASDPNFTSIVHDSLILAQGISDQISRANDFKGQATTLLGRIANAIESAGTPLPDIPFISTLHADTQAALQTAINAINDDFITLQSNTAAAGFNVKQRDARNFQPDTPISLFAKLLIGGGVLLAGVSIYMIVRYKTSDHTPAFRRRHAMAGRRRRLRA